MALLAGVVLLTLFLLRPGAQRLRSRIVGSIGAALGRQVDVQTVQLRLLPRPGFDLENFVVHDDPAFSAEPMLRAQEVTASLRLTSLLRGRLEIARLSLTEPSLNLVRNSAGHWNLEMLLERAAHAAVAPTGKSKTEPRPGFPYIEADSGRINLKIGQEKKPYAFTNADFALWQESENQWGMRLEAQPVRTDFNLSDTGDLRISGTWQRAASLRETPLDFNFHWDRAQLGQVSKLIQGKDRGWRGSLQFSANLSGTPADLKLNTAAVIGDFHRYDILGSGTVELAGQCAGRYSTASQTLSDINCVAPVGDGMVTLGGDLSGWPGAYGYHLELGAQNVPVPSLAALLRHAKRDIPEDITAAGKLNAHCRINRKNGDGAGSATWEGHGEATNFRLASAITKTEVVVDRIPFTASSPGEALAGAKLAGRKTTHETSAPDAAARVEVGPFALPLGKPTPARVDGWVSRVGYNFNLVGDAQVQRVLLLARTLGLPVSSTAADGIAKVDLQLAGNWSGFAAPRATGTAQLHSVRAEIRGINAPLQINSASLVLAHDQIAVQNLVAALGSTNLTGSLMLSRPCAALATCAAKFDLHANQIVTDELKELVNPSSHKRPWYRWLSPAAQASPALWATVHATGKLAADKLAIRGLVATKASAAMELEDGKLRFSALRASLLGGKHEGNWVFDFSSKPPACSGSGTLDHVALEQLGDLMHADWITGSANGSYRATASGATMDEWLSAASVTLQFEVRDGSLPHVELIGAGAPLRIHRLVGHALIHDGKFEIQQGKLETVGGIYQVSGTASSGRILDLRLLRDGVHGFSVTGTLLQPQVNLSTPETRAALKP